MIQQDDCGAFMEVLGGVKQYDDCGVFYVRLDVTVELA